MNFNDIAAFEGHKISESLKRVIRHPQFQKLFSKIESLKNFIKGKNLGERLLEFQKRFSSVQAFQKILVHLIEENIDKTTDSFTYSGTENLPKDKGFILLSNHRSIALDAAFANYVLYKERRNTAYNGCGDNIMETSWLGELIRINKGFVVKRKVEDVDDKIAEIQKLSLYISDLVNKGQSVWIANRGGRAKDGMDTCDSVVLAMLHKAHAETSWEEWSEKTALIPLSISWEYSPCDLILADDLAHPERKKAPHRDFQDITTEISSPKGRVHLAFGKAVRGTKRREIVAALDREVQSNFRLYDANFLAYSMTHDLSSAERSLIDKNIDMKRANAVLQRGMGLNTQAFRHFLGIYANPVVSALRHYRDLETLLSACLKKA